ncbi:hypothetical protein [Allorhizocola rhizosphaerae]|nr:hypothetical protein [Allorhizocola rhizosphaerae]
MFSTSVQGVESLPPLLPDPPVHDSGMIAAPNPSTVRRTTRLV